MTRRDHARLPARTWMSWAAMLTAISSGVSDADLQPDGRVHPGQGLGREALLPNARKVSVDLLLAPDHADVAGLGPECLGQDRLCR